MDNQFLKRLAENELSFDEYDLIGFSEFLKKQFNIKNINLTLNGIFFNHFSHQHHKWSYEYIFVNKVTGRVIRSKLVTSSYFSFIHKKPTPFDNAYGPFLRGEMEGSDGCFAMLRNMAKKCACCGLPDNHPYLGQFTIEHINSLSYGGKNKIHNLEVVHESCNVILNNHSRKTKEKIKKEMRRLAKASAITYKTRQLQKIVLESINYERHSKKHSDKNKVHA